jgi:hypothetical protein
VNANDPPPPVPSNPNLNDLPPATGKRRWPAMLVGILVILIAVALVGLMIFLHLNGTLGPGNH